MRVDEWGIDVCYSGTQKCLGAPPGLAPITLSEVCNGSGQDPRKRLVQSFYFNLQDLENYWGQSRSYHHTAPISMTYALREALRMMMEEGIDNRISRHAKVPQPPFGPACKRSAWSCWPTPNSGSTL